MAYQHFGGTFLFFLCPELIWVRAVLFATSPARVRVGNQPGWSPPWLWTSIGQGVDVSQVVKSCKQLPLLFCVGFSYQGVASLACSLMPTAFLAKHKDPIVVIVLLSLAGALVSIGNVTSRALVFDVFMFYFVDHTLLVKIRLPLRLAKFDVFMVQKWF